MAAEPHAVAPRTRYRIATPPAVRVTISDLGTAEIDPLVDAIADAVHGTARSSIVTDALYRMRGDRVLREFPAATPATQAPNSAAGARSTLARYLPAAHTWFADNDDAATGFEPSPPSAAEPGTTELRDWARSVGLAVSDKAGFSGMFCRPGTTRTTAELA